MTDKHCLSCLPDLLKVISSYNLARNNAYYAQRIVVEYKSIRCLILNLILNSIYWLACITKIYWIRVVEHFTAEFPVSRVRFLQPKWPSWVLQDHSQECCVCPLNFNLATFSHIPSHFEFFVFDRWLQFFTEKVWHFSIYTWARIDPPFNTNLCFLTPEMLRKCTSHCDIFILQDHSIK